MAGEPAVKTTLYKSSRSAWLLLPGVVPAVRKWQDASHKGCRGPRRVVPVAFSSEVDIGSHEENASKRNQDLAGLI
jgi:hypothetical protein